MSREFKRVPLDFRWPLQKTWVGYDTAVVCPKCNACGDVNKCTGCYGEMTQRVRTGPPDGPGWQLWQTTGAGSPASLVDNPDVVDGREPCVCSYSETLTRAMDNG